MRKKNYFAGPSVLPVEVLEEMRENIVDYEGKGLSIIEASHDLGANEMQTLWKVVIPAIMPGIISGFMMSVTMSLEDYVITALVSGPGSSTLPLYVYSMIRFGVSPVINALSFVLILIITVVAVVLKNRLKSFAAAH